MIIILNFYYYIFKLLLKETKHKHRYKKKFSFFVHYMRIKKHPTIERTKAEVIGIWNLTVPGLPLLIF